MDKNTLIELIDNHLSVREIAKETEASPSTVRWWMRKFSLKTKINVGNKNGLAKKPSYVLTNFGDGQDIYFCKKCKETDVKKFYKNTKSKCARCSKKQVLLRLRKYKQSAIEYKGGRCIHCGYNKCPAGLDFHHRDPSAKDINWKKMRTWKTDIIKSELDKCDLVCRNCHSEIHYREIEND